MNIFLVQLVIAFLPGLIGVQLDAHYAMKKLKQAEFLSGFPYVGLVTYATVYYRRRSAELMASRSQIVIGKSGPIGFSTKSPKIRFDLTVK